MASHFSTAPHTGLLGGGLSFLSPSSSSRLLFDGTSLTQKALGALCHQAPADERIRESMLSAADGLQQPAPTSAMFCRSVKCRFDLKLVSLSSAFRRSKDATQMTHLRF